MRVHVCRLRSRGGTAIVAAGAQKLEARLDVRVSGVELGSALVSVERVGDLVVARLVLEKRQQRERSRIGLLGVSRRTRVPRSYQTSEM